MQTPPIMGGKGTVWVSSCWIAIGPDLSVLFSHGVAEALIDKGDYTNNDENDAREFHGISWIKIKG